MQRHMVRIAMALGFALVLSGCVYEAPPPAYSYNPYDPGQRAMAGGLIGAGAGAALGGMAGGGQGAAMGALAGGAIGAATGAATTPQPPYYGYDGYRRYDGDD